MCLLPSLFLSGFRQATQDSLLCFWRACIGPQTEARGIIDLSYTGKSFNVHLIGLPMAQILDAYVCTRCHSKLPQHLHIDTVYVAQIYAREEYPRHSGQHSRAACMAHGRHINAMYVLHSREQFPLAEYTCVKPNKNVFGLIQIILFVTGLPSDPLTSLCHAMHYKYF